MSYINKFMNLLEEFGFNRHEIYEIMNDLENKSVDLDNASKILKLLKENYKNN